MCNLRLNGNQTSAYPTTGKTLLSMRCIAKASKSSYMGQKEWDGYTSISGAT